MSQKESEYPTVLIPEFLDAIFENLHETPLKEEYVAVCPKKNRTEISSGLIRYYGLTFFCVSSINGQTITKQDKQGEDYTYIGRTRANLVKAYCLVLDDVGTKATAPDVLPHWQMETSEGNEQWGYFIQPEDLSDSENLDYYEACVRSLAQAGFSDNGAGGSYRIMRLPNSRKENSTFKAKVLTWRPERPRYQLQDLMSELQLQPVYPENRVRTKIADETDEGVSFNQWVDSVTENYFHLFDLSRRVSDVLHILKDLPSDLPYSDWLTVGMALKTLPPGNFPYRIFHKWSQQGDLYDPSEWPNKWDSFDDLESKNPISLNSIFYLAKSHRISLTSNPNPELSDLFREMNKRCGYVSFEKKPRMVVSPSLLDEHLLPDTKWEWYERDSFIQRFATLRCKPYGPKLLEATTKGIPLKWLNSPYRTTYNGVQLAAPPYQPKEGYFNLWNGFAIEASNGDISIFEKHIREVLGAESPECGEYLVKYFAWCIQNPGRVAGTMIVLKGSQGIGKSIVSDAMRNIFGPHGKLIDSDDGVTSRFNRPFEGAMFVSLEEAGWAGDKKGQGKLKNLITGTVILVEPKGCDSYQVRNAMKAVLTTNHEWAVPVASDDRRFAVFEVSDEYRRNAEYFRPLKSFIKTNLGDIFGWLLNYPLEKNWHPADHIPQTKALREQKIQSMHHTENHVESFFRLELESLNPFRDRLRIDQKVSGVETYAEELICRSLKDNDIKGMYTYWIPTTWLKQRVTEHVRRLNPHFVISSRKLTKDMERIFGKDSFQSSVQIIPAGKRGYLLPTADVLRQSLNPENL